MTKKSNLSLRFTRVWEKHCLKTAAATLLLCCVLPVQTKADTYKTQETASIQQQTVKTTGVIIDNTGEPLIGVSVKVQGTNTGTITDLDGKFSIDTPPKALLEFSFIGYKTITMEVTGKELHITMQEDSKQLDEVVVVGYGSQKKVKRYRICKHGQCRRSGITSRTKCVTSITRGYSRTKYVCRK